MLEITWGVVNIVLAILVILGVVSGVVLAWSIILAVIVLFLAEVF